MSSVGRRWERLLLMLLVREVEVDGAKGLSSWERADVEGGALN